MVSVGAFAGRGDGRRFFGCFEFGDALDEELPEQGDSIGSFAPL